MLNITNEMNLNIFQRYDDMFQDFLTPLEKRLCEQLKLFIAWAGDN